MDADGKTAQDNRRNSLRFTWGFLVTVKQGKERNSRGKGRHLIGLSPSHWPWQLEINSSTLKTNLLSDRGEQREWIKVIVTTLQGNVHAAGPPSENMLLRCAWLEKNKWRPKRTPAERLQTNCTRSPSLALHLRLKVSTAVHFYFARPDMAD